MTYVLADRRIDVVDQTSGDDVALRGELGHGIRSASEA